MESLITEIQNSFGVTQQKAKQYVDQLVTAKILIFVADKRAVVKDGRKLEAMAVPCDTDGRKYFRGKEK